VDAVEQKADQPVRDAVVGPSPAPAADLAPPALGGFAAAMGNQAFGAYVSRTPRAVPAGQVLARDKPPKVKPEDVTANDRQKGLIQSLITLPLASASGNMAGKPPGKPMLQSVRRRVAAARGAFRSFHFPLASKPGQRMQDAQARVDVALALIDGMLSEHPDQLLRAHWQKTLALCKSLARHLPRPTADEPEDKRALMRDSVSPAVAAAIADIPAIVDAENSDAMLQLVAAHDNVPDAIIQVAGQQGVAAAVEFKKGIELIKLHAKPEEEQAKFIHEHLDRAGQSLLRLNEDPSEDTDLVEPGEEPLPPDPAPPPDPPSSPNALPPPPPPPIQPPTTPGDAGVTPPAAGVTP
jgi:hypothetical protein